MKVHYSSKTVEWETPQELFDELDREFHFTLDVCANSENAKCAKFFTKEQDGLVQDWRGETVWMNPPYGHQIKDWVKKISEEGGVALLPARTDTRWFHDYILGKAEIRFLRGRVKFNGARGTSVTCAPFPSMVCIFKV